MTTKLHYLNFKQDKYFKYIINIFNKKNIFLFLVIIFILFLINISTFTVSDFKFLQDYEANKFIFDSKSIYKNIMIILTEDDILINPSTKINIIKIITIDTLQRDVKSVALHPYYLLDSIGLNQLNIYDYFKNNTLSYKTILDLIDKINNNYLNINAYNYFFINKQNLLNYLFFLGVNCDLDKSFDFANELNKCIDNFFNRFHDITFIFKLFSGLHYLSSSGIYTNLTQRDMFDIFIDINNSLLPVKSLLISDNYKKDSLEFINLFIPDYYKINQSIYNLYASLNVIKEQARIEVFNSTNIQGLAFRIARMINNYGGRVITFNNFPENFDITTIFVANQNKDFTNTLKLLRFILKNNNVSIIYDTQGYNFSGDIAIIIGNDFY